MGQALVVLCWRVQGTVWNLRDCIEYSEIISETRRAAKVWRSAKAKDTQPGSESSQEHDLDLIYWTLDIVSQPTVYYSDDSRGHSENLSIEHFRTIGKVKVV